MIDWQKGLRFAIGLGLKPADFWRLSLKEWQIITSAFGGTQINPAALDKAHLGDLMARFPDNSP